jgi:hypothetical protein
MNTCLTLVYFISKISFKIYFKFYADWIQKHMIHVSDFFGTVEFTRIHLVKMLLTKMKMKTLIMMNLLLLQNLCKGDELSDVSIKKNLQTPIGTPMHRFKHGQFFKQIRATSNNS